MPIEYPYVSSDSLGHNYVFFSEGDFIMVDLNTVAIIRFLEAYIDKKGGLNG